MQTLVRAGAGDTLLREARAMQTIDLEVTTLRDLNQMLHRLGPSSNETHFRIINPRGRHAIAAGVDAPATIEIDGNVGYYCAGMNKKATVIINGSAGTGVAENMMSGLVHVRGDASQSAGATGCGGLLVIDGNASARCGISLRGLDIVVKGSVGHMSAFMAQAGTLVALEGAGEALGDSIYEARLYVRGPVKSLGADCIEKPMRDEHKAQLDALLDKAGIGGKVDISEFKRFGSARKLYHFHIDNVGAY
jgi:methylamine---glutamate N-methyltransferase subunit B